MPGCIVNPYIIKRNRQLTLGIVLHGLEVDKENKFIKRQNGLLFKDRF
jgi:hypothetical protein